jgi:4,5-DOPA dioxygenase extradiol
MNGPMPSVFFGHGNPMNAVQQNDFTDGWRRVAASMPKPSSILAISAHWFVTWHCRHYRPLPPHNP